MAIRRLRVSSRRVLPHLALECILRRQRMKSIHAPSIFVDAPGSPDGLTAYIAK